MCVYVCVRLPLKAMYVYQSAPRAARLDNRFGKRISPFSQGASRIRDLGVRGTILSDYLSATYPPTLPLGHRTAGEVCSSPPRPSPSASLSSSSSSASSVTAVVVSVDLRICVTSEGLSYVPEAVTRFSLSRQLSRLLAAVAIHPPSALLIDRKLPEPERAGRREEKGRLCIKCRMLFSDLREYFLSKLVMSGREQFFSWKRKLGDLNLDLKEFFSWKRLEIRRFLSRPKGI